MAQVLGIVDLIWKGVNLQVATKGAKLVLGGLRNDTVTYGRTAGRSQQYAESKITATVHLKKGQSYGDIFSVAEGELQAICDTGQTYIFHDAFLTGDHPTITSGEGGNIELNWAASGYEEIIAS